MADCLGHHSEGKLLHRILLQRLGGKRAQHRLKFFSSELNLRRGSPRQTLENVGVFHRRLLFPCSDLADVFFSNTSLLVVEAHLPLSIPSQFRPQPCQFFVSFARFSLVPSHNVATPSVHCLSISLLLHLRTCRTTAPRHAATGRGRFTVARIRPRPAPASCRWCTGRPMNIGCGHP